MPGGGDPGHEPERHLVRRGLLDRRRRQRGDGVHGPTVDVTSLVQWRPRACRSSPTSTSTRSSPRSRSSRTRRFATSRSSSAATLGAAASCRPRTTSRGSFGIHSAMSAAEALRRCPQAVFVRPRHALYRQYSRAVWDTVAQVVPRIERTGIDEGYLDLGDRRARLRRERAQLASAVQTSVRATTSLTCSLGVGTSKVVCKIASDRRKPGGITVVPAGKRGAIPRPARRPPSAGRRATRRRAASRRRRGHDRRARRLSETPSSGRSFRDRSGTLLRDRARGIDPRDLELEGEPVSISAEDTFARDISERDVLHAEVRRLAEVVSERLAGLEPLGADGDCEAPLRRLLDQDPLDDASCGGRRRSDDRRGRVRPARSRAARSPGSASARRRRRLRPLPVPPAQPRRSRRIAACSKPRSGGSSRPARSGSEPRSRCSPVPERAGSASRWRSAPGALIAAVAYELVYEAFETDLTLASSGFAAGALAFYVGDWAIDRRGGHGRKSVGRAAPAGRKRERDRARHDPRRHPGVVRARRVAPAGRRSSRPLSSSASSSRTSPSRSRERAACSQAGWTRGAVVRDVERRRRRLGARRGRGLAPPRRDADRRRRVRARVRRRGAARHARRHAHARGVRARRPRGRARSPRSGSRSGSRSRSSRREGAAA